MNTDLSESILQSRREVRCNWYRDEINKRGKALAAIFREFCEDPLKPWLYSHPTIEEYCAATWNMTYRRTHQLIAADNLKALMIEDAPDLAPEITGMTERAARVLVETPAEKRVEVLRAAVKSAKVNSRTLKQAKARIIDGETGEPEKPTCCPTCKRPL